MQVVWWLPLATAIIAATAALAGTVISPWAGARHARRQWLLTRRTESYEQFFNLLQEIQFDTLIRKIANQSDKALLPQRTAKEFAERTLHLHETSNRVQLYASDKLRASAQLVSATYGALALAILIPTDDKEREERYRAFEETADRAKVDLRHELSVERRSWSRGFRNSQGTGG
jgi:hypothetical protein